MASAILCLELGEGGREEIGMPPKHHVHSLGSCVLWRWSDAAGGIEFGTLLGLVLGMLQLGRETGPIHGANEGLL